MSTSGINPVTLPLGLRSSVIKAIKTEKTEQCLWRTLAGDEEHAEKSIIKKEDDLAATDPFNVGMMKVLDGYNLDIDAVDVDKILLSTLEEIENKQQSRNSDKSDIDINEKIEFNKVDGEMTVAEGEGSLNVLKEPIMRLTEEETNRLQLLINDTQFTLRKCCPVFLFQADMAAMIDVFILRKTLVQLSMTINLKILTLFSANRQTFPSCLTAGQGGTVHGDTVSAGDDEGVHTVPPGAELLPLQNYVRHALL